MSDSSNAVWPGIKWTDNGDLVVSCGASDDCTYDPAYVYHFKGDLLDRQVAVVVCKGHKASFSFDTDGACRNAVVNLKAYQTNWNGADYSEAVQARGYKSALLRCRGCGTLIIGFANRGKVFCSLNDERCYKCREGNGAADGELRESLGRLSKSVDELKRNPGVAEFNHAQRRLLELETTLKDLRTKLDNETSAETRAANLGAAQKMASDLVTEKLSKVETRIGQENSETYKRLSGHDYELARLRGLLEEQRKDKGTMTMNVKQEAKDAAVRAAGRQFVKAVRVPIARALAKSAGDATLQAKIAEVLDSPVGDVIVSLLLGVGLEHVPTQGMLPPAFENAKGVIARELRVRGTEGAMDQTMDLVMGPLREALGSLLAGGELRGIVETMELPAPAEAAPSAEEEADRKVPLRVVGDSK